MKRIFAFILCLLLFLSLIGCADTSQKIENNTPVVIIPDYETKATVNGYKQSNDKETETQEDLKISSEYFANKSTKKFHINSCTYAQKIKNENLYTTKNRDELIGGGYQPCKKCNP